MDQRGAIAQFETTEDAKRAGYTTPLTEAEAKALYGVNRKDRRAQLADFRRQERNKVKKEHQNAKRKKRRK